MAFGPLENFRNFLSSRPPLVLFVVCIGMVAIAFISYAYYVKYHDIYNPDANEQLTKFIDKVAGLNLCTKLSNRSWSLGDSARSGNITLMELLRSNQEVKDAEYDSFSFLMSISVSFLQKKNSFPKPVTNFVSSFQASLLGVSGGNENKSVAIQMVPATSVNLKCANKVCLSEYTMCATILAPVHIIPSYARQQKTRQCDFNKNISGKSFVAWVDVTAPPNTNEEHSVAECKSNILLKAERVKEKFTVMLTLEKRSEVNMHLMHSSYFLFVVVITILLFGIVTGGGERKHARNQGNHYSVMGS